MKKIKELINKIKQSVLRLIPQRFRRQAAEGEEPAPRKKAPEWLRKSVWAVFLTGVLTCFFVFCAFAWFSFIYLDDEFDLSAVDSALNYTSVVYGVKDGGYVEAETLHTSENRIWASIDSIPLNLQRAFISIEDERFYKHSGVDLLRTGKAVLNFFNPASDSSFGGSTITQQVIKNITGEDQTTVTRKIQEIRRAWYVEREYKKDQILEVYLNTIYLSQGCYGVQTAAEHYFSKSLDELTLLECASIASITKLPTYYDPIQNPENNLKRAQNVINKMLELGYITEEEAEAAKAEELTLRVGQSNKNESGAEVNSYFVDQVVEDVIDALVNEKGYSESYARSLVYSGGIQIYSTLDLDVQASIDKIYTDPSNFPTVTSNGESLQSAIVIIDNRTGAIVGMAGGVGEKTTARGLNRATQSYRQPGSCMKPIGTYGPAIEYGTTINGVRVAPGMLLKDEAVRLDSNGNPWPKNYDSTTEKFMTVQAAIDQSKNTIAVQVNNALGAKTAYNFLEKNLGITSLVSGSGYDANDQAMALGGLTKGISVKEITAAYSAFANDGTYTKPYTFTKILDQNGRVLLENRVESHTAMEKNTAAVVNQMLEHAVDYGTGWSGRFDSGRATCGKTGTTSDDKDRWFVGYTKQYSAGVWVGYDKPAVIQFGGANPAGTAFKKVMGLVHQGLAYQEFEDPTGLISVELCTESGKLPTEKCAAETRISGLFFADSLPSATCDVCGAEDPDAPVDETPATPVPETPATPSVPESETPTNPETPVTPETPGDGEGEGGNGEEDPAKDPEDEKNNESSGGINFPIFGPGGIFQ
ncbi:MAG: PBP1A family penicillin-binding protein [Clostridia bacterium]|nr:PBP1A family penicillin-binding protein [Clostridia bacterium]